MLQGGAVGNISEQTLASYVQPLQTELPTWRPEFTGKVDEATRRRFGRGPTISPRKDRFDKVLDAVDGLFAGFANAMTFGGSNYLREAWWGQTATQNHHGTAYNIGTVVGIGYSFALGYGLGRGAAMGAWAAKGIRGYMIAGDVVGVAQSSYNISTGQFSAIDTFGFVPTIGWGMGAMRRGAGTGGFGMLGRWTEGAHRLPVADQARVRKEILEIAVSNEFLQRAGLLGRVNRDARRQFWELLRDAEVIGSRTGGVAGLVSLGRGQPHVLRIGIQSRGRPRAFLGLVSRPASIRHELGHFAREAIGLTHGFNWTGTQSLFALERSLKPWSKARLFFREESAAWRIAGIPFFH